MLKPSSPSLSSIEHDNPGKDLDIYVKRFHKRALDCYDLVDEEVLVNVCLHDMRKEYRIFLEIYLSCHFQIDGSDVS